MTEGAGGRYDIQAKSSSPSTVHAGTAHHSYGNGGFGNGDRPENAVGAHAEWEGERVGKGDLETRKPNALMIVGVRVSPAPLNACIMTIS